MKSIDNFQGWRRELQNDAVLHFTSILFSCSLNLNSDKRLPGKRYQCVPTLTWITRQSQSTETKGKIKRFIH